MELKINENNQSEWDEFLFENNASFLQSFGWGEFQKKFFKKVYRISVAEKGIVVLRALVIKEKFAFKNFFYIPFGPVFDNNISLEQKKMAFEFFLKEIQKIAKKENIVFLKIEPKYDLPAVCGFNFCNSLKRIQPQKTLVLDLDKTEQEIFDNFSKNTRYNIRLAERKGVEIKILNEYSNEFYKLIKKTRERQGFNSYQEDYYKKFLDIHSENLKTNLFLAEYQGKVIMASIVLFFGNKAVSLHTGLDYRYRKVKASNLLRWRVMQEAKKRGCAEYDFWGIDFEKYPGVSYFKKGFNGKEFEYAQDKDIVFQKFWYKIYLIIS